MTSSYNRALKEMGHTPEDITTKTPILDMTAGSRMFWWDKQNKNVTFVDKRDVEYELPDRMIKVHPDIVADWAKKLPFSDNKFHMVVFDPPHLLHAGDSSWLKKKYWVLNKDTWQDDLKHGFDEAFRVLKPYGTLIFKWNDDQIKVREVLKAVGYTPLFGDKRSKTHWLIFMKLGD